MTTHILTDAAYDALVADLAALQVAPFPDLDPAHVDLDPIKLALADRAGIYPHRVTLEPGFDHGEAGEVQANAHDLDHSSRILIEKQGEAMDFEQLSTQSAVVFWCPIGMMPEDSNFEITNDETSNTPPRPNPEAWWKASELVTYFDKDILGIHGKKPWLKIGDQLLSPNQVHDLYTYITKKRCHSDAMRSE